jgi:Domain of unknown function (DUF5011)/HYR domain/Putative peptidoglycan binding domain
MKQISGSFSRASLLLFLLVLFTLFSYPAFTYAAIVQRGVATVATSGTTALTVAKPAGVVPGDVMIATIAQGNNNTNSPALSGWTLIDGRSLAGTTPRYGAVLYKVAGASEPTNYTFTLGSGSNSGSAAIIAFSGVDVSGTPFDVAPGVISVQGNQTGVSATSITTGSANAAVVMLGMAAGSSPSWSGWTTASPGGLVELFDAQHVVNTQTSVGGAWAIKTASGNTATGSATLSAAERNGAILIALRPQVAAPTTGTLTIVKNTTGGNGAFTFALSATTSVPSITTASGSGTTSLAIVPGTFSLSENVPSGWNLTSAVCSSGSPASFTITAGNTITCTFANNLPDTTAPVITQTSPVATPANDATPAYGINSTEAGTIIYGGTCNSGVGSPTLSAAAGNQTLSLPLVSEGAHSTCTVRVTDASGNASNILSVPNFFVDITPPSGATTSYIDGYTDVPAIDVDFTIGSDPVGSGLNMATGRLQRRVATLNTNGTCGTFGTFATIATTTASPYTDTVGILDARCYQYQYVISDLAGNTGTSPANASIVKVDTTAPIISAVAPASNANINSVASVSDINFTLSEAALMGSITITRTGGAPDPGSPKVCTLIGTALNSGAHTAFNLSDTVNGCQSAVTLVNGATYTFEFQVSDRALILSLPVTNTNITYDASIPTVAIEQAAAQTDPASGVTINFTVTFNRPVTGFTATDVVLSGSEPGSRSVSVTGSGATYTVAVTGMTAVGTVVASVGAGAATDVFGNASAVATSVDNSVLFNNGFYQPTAGTQVANAVGATNAGNATSSNNLYVLFDSATDIVDFTNFNLPAIPSGATINGIEVLVEGNRATSRVGHVMISWNGGTSSTTKNATFASATDAVIALGGAGDTWGRTWSPNDFTNGNFKLRMDANVGTGNYSVDQVRVRVHFTPDTAVPVLSQITPVGVYTNDSTPSYAFSSTEVGTIQYTGDCASGTILAGTDTNPIVFSTLADGAHTNCTITVTDVAGNVSAPLIVSAFTVDTAAPTTAITFVSSASLNPIATSSVTVFNSAHIHFVSDGTGSPVAQTQCAFDGGATATCNSPFIAASLSDGAHSIAIHSVDAANNIGTASNFVWTVDTAAPVISVPTVPVAEATSAAGASVTYVAPTAIDAIAGTASVVCDALSGNTFAIGTTTVNCSSLDGVGNTATAQFTIVVRDSSAPVISSHVDIVEEATSAAGAMVSYTAPSTSDAVSGAEIATCAPVSGINYAVGTTTVFCNAVDAHGNNASTTSFLIIVSDTIAPIIAPHDNVSAEATSASGATITYVVPTTSDAVAGQGNALCAPVSGTVFAIGTTTVTCAASDAAGNVAAPVTFSVHIFDRTAPIISPHTPVSAEATSAAGAVVTYSSPETSDVVDGAQVALCTPASGSSFAMGTTSVFCNQTDSAENPAAQTSFEVTVTDSIAPIIKAHELVSAEATSAFGANVSYTAPSTNDAVDGSGIAICTPASGSLFAIGDTTLYCDSTDAHGNAASQTTFIVRVADTTSPVIDSHADVMVEATGAMTPVSWTNPTATDVVDGMVSVTCTPISGTAFSVGSHTVMCTSTDSRDNVAIPTTFSVIVTDTTAPVISLVGATPVTLEVHSAYADPGATASDSVDGTITSSVVVTNEVNVHVLGEYHVSYNVSDSNGNAAVPVVRTVHVVDTENPVITLSGANSQIIEVHSAYVELGATIADNYDTELSALIDISALDLEVVGEYNVTYNAQDSSGNTASQVMRTVKVVDTTNPTISLNGVSPTTIEVHSSYSDLGAIAHDNYDADVAVSATGVVNTHVVGTYTLHYNHTDTNGNAAAEATRTIQVVDTTAPTITLNGAHPVTIEVHNEYTDAGAIAQDNYDSDTPVGATGTILAGTIGTYTLHYNFTDAHGNMAIEVARTVHVVDTTIPVIASHADEIREATSAAGVVVTYVSPTVSDNLDPSTTAICVPASGSGFSIGNTPVTCSHTDTNGNVASSTAFVVRVVDTTPPVITLIGSASITLSVGEEYTEEGASVSDVVDGVSAANIGGDAVNTLSPGTYDVIYSKTDAHGNVATVVPRTVVVEDTAAPVFAYQADVHVEATSASGAIVHYASPAVSDNVDESMTVLCAPATGSQFALGTTTIHCSVEDTAGNATSTQFAIAVVDTTPPTISLDGLSSIEIVVGGAYDEQGASAHDAIDGEVSVSIGGDTVDTGSIGTYDVTYDAVDERGNVALQVTRTVLVRELTTGVLVVRKIVDNDVGGDRAASDFSFQVDGHAAQFFNAGGENAFVVEAGLHTVAEVNANTGGYFLTFGEGCSSDGSITISVGATSTCILTNRFSTGSSEGAPVPPSANGSGGNGPVAGSLPVLTAVPPPAGQVLGASTTAEEQQQSCSTNVSSYMGLGKRNNVEDVRRLQEFLNLRVGANLPITGFFGTKTRDAVKKFQNQYAIQILRPWGIVDPTGYVYKTTLRWINMTHCPALDLPLPKLS